MVSTMLWPILTIEYLLNIRCKILCTISRVKLSRILQKILKTTSSGNWIRNSESFPDKNKGSTLKVIPMWHILLQDQVQLQHADQRCCVLHPSSVSHPILNYIRYQMHCIQDQTTKYQVLTSFVEFTTASTSRFHGFPLQRYIFELIS
jgi:hypothetical protein